MKISKVLQLCDEFLMGKTSLNRTIFSAHLVLWVFSLVSFTASYYMKYEKLPGARRKTLFRLQKTTKDYAVV